MPGIQRNFFQYAKESTLLFIFIFSRQYVSTGMRPKIVISPVDAVQKMGVHGIQACVLVELGRIVTVRQRHKVIQQRLCRDVCELFGVKIIR
ncbi:hypothetical protein [Longimonas halophila]|uniref:hypothetical protein n=1 Tax=Longimonas halophila TaxID=1469170 RepID=UPI001FEB6517|nr:hypothetical protein [Longimonas halophila]